MHNIVHEIRDGKLILTINVGQDALRSAPPSSTGKTKLVATSSGNIPVTMSHGAVNFSVNVSTK